MMIKFLAYHISNNTVKMMLIIVCVVLTLSGISLSTLYINTAPPKGRTAYAVLDDIKTKVLDGWVKARLHADVSMGKLQHAKMIPQSQLATNNFLILLYTAKDGDNIFTNENIKIIKNFEDKITTHSKYIDYCWVCPIPVPNVPAVTNCDNNTTITKKKCRLPHSIINYFYPTTNNKDVIYNGKGNKISNIKNTLEYLIEKKNMNPLLSNSTSFFFSKYSIINNVTTSNDINDNNNKNLVPIKSEYTRSMIYYGAPAKSYMNVQDNKLEQEKFISKFNINLKSEFLDMEMNKINEQGKIEVRYFGADKMFQTQVNEILALVCFFKSYGSQVLAQY